MHRIVQVATTIACPGDVPMCRLPKPCPEDVSYSQTLKGSRWQSNALLHTRNACEMDTAWDMAKRKSKHIATNTTRIEAPPAIGAQLQSVDEASV
jgi:hypothetical protein